MGKASIVVIGSINMDLVLAVSRLPLPGETLAGGAVRQIAGGKGANQAVAAARLGARVHMIGRIGTDSFGPVLLGGLKNNRVDTRYVKTTPGESGIAVILVQPGGDNSIVLSRGANAKLTPADVKSAIPVLRQADVVMLQLEIPISVVKYSIDLCRKLSVRVVLDPAPVPEKFPREFFSVDVLCPNETEAASLAQKAGVEAVEMARYLQGRGAKNVVLKLGRRGSLHLGEDGEQHHARPFKVRAVDTTAAGDSMTAGVAVAIGEGRSWAQALQFGNAAGALACTTIGAQPSIPTRAAVEAFIRGSSRSKRVTQ